MHHCGFIESIETARKIGSANGAHDRSRLKAGLVKSALGDKPDAASLDKVVDALAQVAIAWIRGDAPSALAARLALTEPLARDVVPRAITFSGGVSEYIYGREERDFGDIARALAHRLAAACASGEIALPLAEPREGIRATVIGASQFTVQVSGKTIHVTEEADLPLRNVPVAAPRLVLGDTIVVAEVARAIEAAIERAPAADDAPIALAMVPHTSGRAPPLVLMIDGDIGRTLGHILEHELALGRDVVSIDGIELREFDFVDVGEVIRPADVVPVVIKSLLFSGTPVARHATDTHYRPLQPRRSPE